MSHSETTEESDPDSALAEIEAKHADAREEYLRQKRVLLEIGIKIHTLRRDQAAISEYRRQLRELSERRNAYETKRLFRKALPANGH